MSDIDKRVLELSLSKLSTAFNEFISDCMDEEGKPKQPTMQSLMKARGYLPPLCDKALSKKNPAVTRGK